MDGFGNILCTSKSSEVISTITVTGAAICRNQCFIDPECNYINFRWGIKEHEINCEWVDTAYQCSSCESGLQNAGAECMSHCNNEAGKCDYCGTGKCCQQGKDPDECAPSEGLSNSYGCVCDECTVVPGHDENCVTVPATPIGCILLKSMDGCDSTVPFDNFGLYKPIDPIFYCNKDTKRTTMYDLEKIPVDYQDYIIEQVNKNEPEDC